VLRLLLASLVIIGHAPEMMDGNRVREPLTMLFHTLSLGEIAVDGFFLLSGYLICQSMVRAASLETYLERRVFRIYPAFAIAYLMSVFVLGPIVGAHPWALIPKALLRLLALQRPADYPGQLAGLPYPLLNGSMWTIAYEFRCYLLVALLGMAGMLARRRAMLLLTGVALVASVLATFHAVRVRLDAFSGMPFADPLIGNLPQTLRLTSIFLIGICFFLYRSAVFPRRGAGAAALCAGVASALMFRNPHLAEAGVATFGAVVLFWLAFKANLGPVQRVNDKWDISYGVYLYGWPIATLFRWLNPSISPWALAASTLPTAFAFGAASWWGLEIWSKNGSWSRLRSSRHARTSMPAMASRRDAS
jgi:peptidoglycan/LPS O-acetylase OafA/YrhL